MSKKPAFTKYDKAAANERSVTYHHGRGNGPAPAFKEFSLEQRRAIATLSQENGRSILKRNGRKLPAKFCAITWSCVLGLI